VRKHLVINSVKMLVLVIPGTLVSLLTMQIIYPLLCNHIILMGTKFRGLTMMDMFMDI